MMSLPPLATRLSMPSRTVLAEPTKSITAQAPPLVAAMICFAASGAAPSIVASALTFIAASRFDGVDVDDDGHFAAHGLVQGETHQPEPACTDDHHRLLREHRADFLQGAIRGDAGAGERCGLFRRQIADIEQVARMRHHHVGGVAAVAEDAEIARLEAKLLLAPLADRAFAAAHPRMHEAAIADFHALGIGAKATTSPADVLRAPW